MDTYISKFTELLSKIEVTDKNNNPLEFTSAIKESVNLVLSCKSRNKKIMLIGNGGSASIASHIAVDLWKNCGIRATAFNDSSLLTCISNDFGYPYVFEKPIERFSDEGDLLIAISSSGASINILNGVKAAVNCKVITMSGFKSDNPLRSMGDLNFYVPSYSYGYVEIIHLLLCHYIVDIILNGHI